MNQPSQRQNRHARWRNTDPKLIQQLPKSNRLQIMATMEQNGRHELINTRMIEFATARQNRLSRDQEHLTTGIVVLVGALTFSIAPQLLANQVGRGPLAVSTGFIGGAIASFLAHSSATRVLTGLKLKQSTEQARTSIIKNQMQEASNHDNT